MIVAKSATLFVVAKYDSETLQDSLGGNQNIGDVSMSVCQTAAILKNAGA